MMQEPNATLAAWSRTTRTEVGLTQVLLAEKAGIESRTIIKIESGQGNPTFSTLYPMIRVLHKSADTLFFPEQHLHSPEKERLAFVVAGCSEHEARVLLSICENVLQTLRQIESKSK